MFLYFLSTLSHPISIDLHEVSNYEGKTVVVEGVVTRYWVVSNGAQIIEIKNPGCEKNSEAAILFVEAEIPLEYGDRIQAVGKVQRYKGKWEITVNNEGLIKILDRCFNSAFPLWQLAENPNRYIDTKVNITGVVEKIYDSYFYLVDPDKRYSTIVYYDTSRCFNLSRGAEVYVEALVVYQKEKMRFILNAEEETCSVYVIRNKE
jgi:hypothetical protein